ncbi:olfactory receptor 14A16-like [Alligator sinensis]|uniref:Olfactory receptor n=1 Tax=Alligator sinensis TaxID=38654 RepID=A0A1U8DWI4_ALLSI|nr:olfactory receptor 14A16-like [Alligator sinensis]
MSNQTTVTEFILLGFSESLELQILHVVIFLTVYLIAMMGNLLIFIVVVFDHRLHTPMYFFLMNLSILDIGSISVTVPKSITNTLMNTRRISYAGCATQVFFFVFLVTADFFILTIMAYDRYVAICKPLHYEMLIDWRTCTRMAASAWVISLLYSALHTGNTFNLPFCSCNVINQFYCDIPQVLKLSCSDANTKEIGILAFSMCLGLGCFSFIIVSYVQIFTAVRRIPSEDGQHKAFSTCIPHIMVVSLLLFTAIFAYLKPTSTFPNYCTVGTYFLLSLIMYVTS